MAWPTMGIAEVFELGVGFAAHHTQARNLQIHVATVIALHAGSIEAGGDHHGLHPRQLRWSAERGGVRWRAAINAAILEIPLWGIWRRPR